MYYIFFGQQSFKTKYRIAVAFACFRFLKQQELRGTMIHISKN